MTLSPHQLARLNLAMSCPKEANPAEYPLLMQSLLHGCWASLLATYLPDPMIVNLLVDREEFAHGSIFVSEEERDEYIENDSEVDDEPIPHNSLFLGTLDASEVDRYVKSLEGSRLHFALKARDADGARIRDDIGEGANAYPPANVKPLADIWLDEEFHRLSQWLWELRVVEG